MIMKPLSSFILIVGIMFLLSSLNTDNTTELQKQYNLGKHTKTKII